MKIIRIGLLRKKCYTSASKMSAVLAIGLL